MYEAFQQILYLVTVWIMAMVSAFARAILDRSFHQWYIVCYSALEGSCVGFAVVLVSANRADLHFSNNNNCMFWIGVATLIGGLGKEILVLRRKALSSIFNFETDEPNDNEESK